MTHASVFSGIGGPEVAATMLGWENLFHCEINPFGRRVLDYWYPNSKSYEDITTTDFTEWRGRVNVLTGGFPCQPFSYAGKRGGAQDDRYLWPYMFRCIDQIRPDWVVAENVAGILTMVEQGEVSEVASAPALFDTFDRVRRYQLRETFTLQRICDDLEGHGYAVQPVLVPACGVGAPHRRDRVFIIGHRVTADGEERDERKQESGEHEGRENREVKAGGNDSGAVSAENGKEAIADKLQGHCGEDKRGFTPACGSHAADTSDARAESMRRERKNAVHRPRPIADTQEQRSERLRPEQSEVGRTSQVESRRRSCQDGDNGTSAYDDSERLERRYDFNSSRPESPSYGPVGFLYQDTGTAGCNRWYNFPSVSPVHRGNDGLPFDVDRLTISFGKWRTEALKAYGNAIVPQVMYEIFRAIQQVEQDH